MKQQKQDLGKNSIKDNNEILIRTILSVVQDYFYDTTNSSFTVGSPYIYIMSKSDYEKMYLMRISFLGLHKATVLFRFSSEMMADFIKQTMHESVNYDDSNTLKELSHYMIQKMSKTIGKMLMKAMGEDAYFKISSVKHLDESDLQANQVVIPLHWKKYEFTVQFII